MQRRTLILAAGGLAVSVTAGCLGSNNGTSSEPVESVEVEVEFTLDGGDLVATHVSGDVLQSGQTVYVTIGGEKVSETTLEQDVHTGGEIIRVSNANGENYQPRRVGLYLDNGDQPHELATGEVQFTNPAPGQYTFDYDADNDIVVISVGVSSGKLIIESSSITAEDIMWNEALDASGKTAIVNKSVDEIATIHASSGEGFTLVWESEDGSYSEPVASWEAP